MNSEVAVDADKFGNHTPEVRLEKVDKICVMARSFPFDKLLMVQCLKQKGHVVTVTGDDTNDEPTLKEVDIGFSMGILGTEVARESSNIFILDDNFGFVATGVQDENGNMKVDDIIISVVGIVAAAVTIVVVVIPEVLPLAVTLTLAYSMKRMMADRAMVRKLSAYETMGSATDICTVKMGTLTINQMQGTKFWLG
ncbi:putative calcium-transporting ATPase 13, plasma membrane-type [Camellia lanceoleosa]|uniref:Calcium-transporting ATPase 13, plasma membrane-type n=1 Tax=Camellia lanceoleosa TaxID=1840588 RepID=A0ACC0HGU5_9ERIC|nr:putative calcium-transporting ATPase 13, plasma membrane-type [Camellia lanceoleosa]